jgi:hypothetical protein
MNLLKFLTVLSPAVSRVLPGLIAAFVMTSPVWANGKLTHLSGPVTVKKADGKEAAAAPGVEVGTGDTLSTGRNGYVRMEMTDGGEMMLRPNSELVVQNFRFEKNEPAKDSFLFSMLKGGLRTVTGLIGKRGNQDAYRGQTNTATIGIRGTQYDLRVCEANCGALPDGTYLNVRFGSVVASNTLGGQTLLPGQTAFIPPSGPPIILKRDPGVGFTPPANFPKPGSGNPPPPPPPPPPPADTSQGPAPIVCELVPG